MELDDLKQTWKQPVINKTINTNIMHLIQHKTYGPAATLKKAFRKQVIVMTLLPAILLSTSLDDISKPLTSILFWAYILLCAGIVVFALFNYRLVHQMSVMEGNVKSTLEQQLALLQKRMQWKITGLRIGLLFLIVLTETAPYIQHYAMLDKWHSLPPAIRFGAYAALLLLQYVASRKVVYRKFGAHINYLKDLVKEME